MVRTWADDDPKAGLMTRKRALIVEAALKAFLERGYAESSVNKIADDAGVSIKTLYRHFETKDELFSAVMQAACAPPSGAEGSETAAEPGWYAEPPETALVMAGEEYLRHVLSDEQLAIYRVVTRDAHRFPELGEQYRREVMGRGATTFVQYFDRWAPTLGWSVRDCYGAAAAFGGLLKARLFDDAVMGAHRASQEEIASRAKAAAVCMQLLLQNKLF